MSPDETSPPAPEASLFAGIELVVFDKDGTLIDFDAMWSDWSAGMVRDVADATDPELADPLAEALGLDPTTARIIPGSPLAATPMGHLRDLTVDTLAGPGCRRRWPRRPSANATDPPDPVQHGPPAG